MKRLSIPFVAFICLIMLGCATAIPVKVTKPAEIDVKGAKSIAVLPFGFPRQAMVTGLNPYQSALRRLWSVNIRDNPVERSVAQYAESVFTSALLETNFFTVIKSDDLKNVIAVNDTNAKINADVIITGEIVNLDSKVADRSYKDKSGKLIPSFENKVAVDLRFDVILTSNNQLIATKTYSGSATRGGMKDGYSAGELTEETARNIIKGWAGPLKRALAPYVVTEARFLADDEMKDPRMDDAKKHVTDQFYQKAFDLYTSIYGDTKNFAAGFNAAIMKEVLGDLEGAIVDMEALANATTNSKALNEAKRMQRTLEESKISEAQKQGL